MKPPLTVARSVLLLAALAALGCPPSVGPDDDDATGDDDATDDDDAAPGEPRPGYCALDEEIARVAVLGYGGGPASLTGRVYDRRSPLVGAPELSNARCDFHRHDLGACVRCDEGQVCSISGECVDAPRPITEMTLRATVNGVEQVVEANEEGFAYLQLDDADAEVAITVGWPGGEATFGPRTRPGADIRPAVVVEGDYDAPGALTATWTDGGADAFVRTRIPINHHVGGPTFTRCTAPEAEGTFTADAPMVDPLAVVTGLEFQGLHYEHAVAVDVAGGCVQFTMGTQIQASPF